MIIRFFIIVTVILTFAQTNAQNSNDLGGASNAIKPEKEILNGKIPISKNIDWKPIKKDFNGTTMVLVPAGSFMMGSEEGDVNERPAHKQRLTIPFWIDETEVTRASYKKCGLVGVCTSHFDNWFSDSENQPLNYVNWDEAVTYCEWRGARLPTEVEWEYAARGPDSLLYPWGNKFYRDKVHYSRNSDIKTIRVGNYLDGASWVGALDMSGNVGELTRSLFRDYPYINSDGRELIGKENSISEHIVIRGSSFNGTPIELRTTSRNRYFFNSVVNDIGFRCVRSFNDSD